jgi:hypothetical protein
MIAVSLRDALAPISVFAGTLTARRDFEDDDRNENDFRMPIFF